MNHRLQEILNELRNLNRGIYDLLNIPITMNPFSKNSSEILNEIINHQKKPLVVIGRKIDGQVPNSRLSKELLQELQDIRRPIKLISEIQELLKLLKKQQLERI